MRQKLSEGAKPGYDARVGSGLGRGPNLRKKAVAAPWSGTWPAPGATLDLDFANNRGFVRGVGQGGAMDAVTFTRASNATFVKPDGTLSTHANQGALGNNLLTFPQDFDNAAWFAGSGAAIRANTSIAPNGTLTADTLSYTVQFGHVRQTVSLLANTEYTVSVYCRRNSGSNELRFTTNTGVNLGFFTPDSTWTRYSATFTTTGTPFTSIYIASDPNASGFTDVEITEENMSFDELIE